MLGAEKKHKTNIDIHPRARNKAKRVAELFARYGMEIYCIICFNLNDFSQADDIFQKLFLTFLQKPIPSNTENIKAYIYKTITNDILDSIRYKKSYQDRVAKYARQQQNRLVERNPAKKMIHSEQIEGLIDVIQEQLPPRQTEAILLRYIENFTLDEIARRMQVNKTTVSKYVWKGLKKVRNLLHERRLEANAC